MDPFVTVERADSDVSLIVLAGEADLTESAFERELRQAVRQGPGAVVVDCSGLSFLDTRTIDGLLETLNELGEERLAVVAPPGDVRKVFGLTGLELVLPLYASRDEAFEALGVVPQEARAR